MKSRSPDRKRLRTEAGLLRWFQLNDYQRKAFIRIMEMLVEAIDGLDSFDWQHKRSTDILPSWYDVHRDNRVVLLEGGRGTGKSSVMLSLIHACIKPEVWEKEIIINEKLKGRTIWLEPLDMEPLPGPTNLLAAVLARIGAAVELYIPRDVKPDDRRGPRGFLELFPGYLEALQNLQCLQSDVALAWEGNMSERGAHLDPDTYAMEVIRAEQARLSLNRNLSGTLNNLAKNISSISGVINPIFVLPVDDLDLNPTRCLEILRLLRMISVPRLFILVLGNLKMIETVVSLKHTGDLINIAGRNGSRRMDSTEEAYIRKNAGADAFSAMRKLLPPEQRIHLGSMQVWEALNYRPPTSGAENLPRLHALLNMWRPVTINGTEFQPKNIDGERIDSLWDFLLFPVPHSFQNDDIQKTDIEECCYNARTILRVPPRHIADWWSLLQRRNSSDLNDENIGTEEWNEFIDGLGRLCRRAMGVDPFISLRDRQVYREALQKDPSTDGWLLLLGIVSIPTIGPSVSVDEKQPTKNKQFRLCPGYGWRLFPTDSKYFAKSEYLRLEDTDTLNNEIDKITNQFFFSQETASALLLFHDLLGLGPKSKLTQANMRIYRPVELWARTDWKVDSVHVSIFWPVPAYLSFFGYDIFLSYWNKAINEISTIDPQDRLTYLVYSWIDSAFSVVLHPFQPSRQGSGKKPELTDWQSLAENINKLFEKINDETDNLINTMTKQWLRRLANFLMPEVTGIDIEFIEPFGKKEKLRNFWNDHWDEIDQFRNEIFDRFKKKNEDEDKKWSKELKLKGLKEYAKAMDIDESKVEDSLNDLTKSATRQRTKTISKPQQ